MRGRIIDRCARRYAAKVDPAASGRQYVQGYDYDPERARGLLLTLKGVNAALRHASAASNLFAQLRSKDVSPDGKLGGAGYVQEVAQMRKDLAAVVDTLSRFSDTLHDEVTAPHWQPSVEEVQEGPEAVEDVDADGEEDEDYV